MKRYISVLLLFLIVGFQTIPAQALFKSKVEKTKIEQQKKSDKEVYQKVKKQKDIPYKKLRVTNKYDFINMSWWEQYNDKYLTSYIQKAMAYNYDLKVASLTVDEYYQNVKLQMSNELPKLQVGFGGFVAGLPPIASPNRETVHGLALPIIASYEADIFLKNHDKTKSAKKLLEASVYDERAAYIAIVSAVGSVYYNIVRFDKMISVLSEIVDLRKEIYDLMVISHEQGLVSTSDMIKANKSWIAGQTNLLELKQKRVVLLNQLAVLVGESPENINEFKRINYDDVDYKLNIPESISSDVIMQRPDYLKAEAMLKKAGIDVRVSKKEFLPSVDILGLASFASRHLGGLFTTKESALWGALGNISMPIYTGGARIANFKMNKIRFEKALRNYQKINLTAIQEVNDALYSAKIDNQKLEQNKTHLKLETKDFGLTQAKYNFGVISRLELIQMKENLLSTQNLVVANTVDCLLDNIVLYKATGTKY